MRNLIMTIKSWNIENARALQRQDDKNAWHIITTPEEFTLKKVSEINPNYIFAPHWSWIIPKEIWRNYETIVFHSTDLPYGRGGSPIQNLIARGVYQTKISALKVEKGLDTGPIYMKEDFEISKGNVDEILQRGSKIIFEKMIPQIIKNRPQPQPQEGEPTTFSRRTPDQGNLLLLQDPTSRKLYDLIRMLDGEGYPAAYIPLDRSRLEFYDTSLKEGQLQCKTRHIENE